MHTETTRLSSNTKNSLFQNNLFFKKNNQHKETETNKQKLVALLLHKSIQKKPPLHIALYLLNKTIQKKTNKQ